MMANVQGMQVEIGSALAARVQELERENAELEKVCAVMGKNADANYHLAEAVRLSSAGWEAARAENAKLRAKLDMVDSYGVSQWNSGLRADRGDDDDGDMPFEQWLALQPPASRIVSTLQATPARNVLC
jgi:hypothetical protein